MPASVRSTSAAATSGVGTTMQVPRPATVANGDVLIAFVSGDGTPAELTAPPGWAAVTTLSSSDAFPTRAYSKTASSEPATYTFGRAANDVGVVTIIAVAGASTTIPLTSARLASTGFASTSPGVTPAAVSHLELRYVCAPLFEGAISWTAPPGYTMRRTVEEEYLSAATASKQLTSSASSGAATFTRSPAYGVSSASITISIASADNEPAPEPPPPFTPGRGEALYRYVFSRWDGTYLDDLELTGVHFDKRILQPGTFTATIPIPSRTVADKVAAVIPRDETALGIGPGVVTCQIYRGGAPWGEYWITAAHPSRSGTGTPTIQLRGSSLEAYLMHVELQEDKEYAGEDQIDIARDLLTHMQGQQYADLNLVIQSGVSGTTRDRTYAADEATYGQRLTELAQVEGGFEWMINIVAGPGGLERHWVWGAPLGQADPPPHTFSDGTHSGDILEWAEEIDALRGATRWRARGDRISTDASTTSAPLISAAAEATAHLAAGWPRIDKTVNHSSVSEMTTLEGYAQYWAATAPGALRVDSVTVALGAKPSIAPNNLGDSARLYFDNEWHLPHWRTRRIIGIGITPTSATDGKERAQLVLEGQEAP